MIVGRERGRTERGERENRERRERERRERRESERRMNTCMRYRGNKRGALKKNTH